MVRLIGHRAVWLGLLISLLLRGDFSMRPVVVLGAEVSSSSAMTSPYRLNADFSLADEIRHHTKPSLTKQERVLWQMRLYRRNPTFGILENKLLSHEILTKRFGFPQAKILYGGFARKALGNFPIYNRAEFCNIMKDQRLFVLKPISSGRSNGVLIMSEDRWEREQWTVERVADFAETFLLRDWSDYGQQYEHVGVVVQERLMIPEKQEENKVPTSIANEMYLRQKSISPREIIEIKVHVVFGELAGGRLEGIPSLRNPVDIAYCGDQIHYIPRFYSPWDARQAKDDFYRNEEMLREHTETIRTMGKEIAKLYGADWFRLDVFVGPDGWLYINEVTYPSHVFHDDECTVQWLLSKYDNVEITDSKVFWQPILDKLSITAKDFHDTADYQHVRHATDEEYESQFWTVVPPEERVEESSVDPFFLQTMVVCTMSAVAVAIRFRLRWIQKAFWVGRAIQNCIGLKHHRRR